MPRVESSIKKIKQLEKKLNESTNKLKELVEERTTQVKKSEEKYRALVENLHDGIFIIQDDKVVFTNCKVAKAFGYTEKEIKSRNFLDFIVEEDKKLIRYHYQKKLRGEEAKSRYVCRARKKNGEIGYLEISSSLTEFQGRPAVLGVARDVTEQTLSEMEIERRSLELAALNKIGIAVNSSLNLDEILKLAMQKAMRIFEVGVSAIYLLNKEKTAFRLALHSGLSKRFARFVSEVKIGEGVAGQVAQKRKPLFVTTPKILAPKRHKEAVMQEGIKETLSTPLISKGKLLGVMHLGAHKERYFTEEDLRLVNSIGNQVATAIENAQLYEEANLLARALRSALESVIFLDADGNIAFVNPAFEKMFGYGADEILGKPVEVLNVSQKPPVINRELLAEISESKRWEGEIAVYRKNGKEVPMYLQASVITDDKGQPKAGMGVLFDLTERKKREKMEEQLRLTSKLASIGRLAAGVAHEINNPLATIKIDLQRLMKKANKATEYRKTFERMLRVVNHLSDVVISLLQFARKKAPVYSLHKIPELLDKSLKLAETRFAREKKKLIKKHAESIPQVKVDGGQLQQVFLNLAINSLEALCEGGTLKASARYLKEKGLIKIVFSDNGRGIPAENVGKVFEPFYTTKRNGVGLGLAICYGIIESHKGTIDIQSTAGKGTTVTIYLPVKS